MLMVDMKINTRIGLGSRFILLGLVAVLAAAKILITAISAIITNNSNNTHNYYYCGWLYCTVHVNKERQYS